MPSIVFIKSLLLSGSFGLNKFSYLLLPAKLMGSLSFPHFFFLYWFFRPLILLVFLHSCLELHGGWFLFLWGSHILLLYSSSRIYWRVPCNQKILLPESHLLDWQQSCAQLSHLICGFFHYLYCCFWSQGYLFSRCHTEYFWVPYLPYIFLQYYSCLGQLWWYFFLKPWVSTIVIFLLCQPLAFLILRSQTN